MRPPSSAREMPAPRPTSMLEVRNIRHQFGRQEVLHDISFEVGAGEILAIMGASGGGKTTLLKIISALLTPTSGDVILDGVSVVQTPKQAREKLGLVFQSAALFDYLNVRDNIAFGLERKAGVRDIEARVAAVLDEVGLKGSEAKMPSELSGGMRKRVGLARALVMEPSILLYDEPTSGLDPVTAYAIDQLIVETRDRTGCTSVVVSHDVSSVFRVADKIAFLAAGDLTFFGTPGDFRQSRDAIIGELVQKARAEAL